LSRSIASRSRALGERSPAGFDAGVAAVELGGGVQMAPLAALHPGLGEHEVGARGAAEHRVAARVARGRDGVGRLAQERLTADAVPELAGELLAGGLLGTLTQGADALETEGELLGSHAPGSRPASR
jgi:hypothetical protein